MTEKTEAKKYRTVTEVMEMPAGESLAIIAAIAAPVERIVSGSGALKLLFNETVAVANDPEAMESMTAKQRAAINAKMIDLGAEVIALLIRSLSEYMPECKEILAALNGVTVKQLEEEYNGLEVIKMVRELVSDQGFLSLARTFAD